MKIYLIRTCIGGNRENVCSHTVSSLVGFILLSVLSIPCYADYSTSFLADKAIAAKDQCESAGQQAKKKVYELSCNPRCSSDELQSAYDLYQVKAKCYEMGALIMELDKKFESKPVKLTENQFYELKKMSDKYVGPYNNGFMTNGKLYKLLRR